MSTLPSMNLEKSLKRVSELMAWFVVQIEADNAMGLLDKNRIAEDVITPIFSEVYGYSNLKNLNQSGENFPGIDLGDKTKQVAFQISSNANSTKVKETLESFVNHKHYEHYKHLVIYDITTKQRSYIGTGWDEIIDGRFTFSKENDIRDYKDLLATIRHFDLDKIQRIEAILERHFSDAERVPVSELINKHLAKQLAREKNSKKYIPDIFVEVADVKDSARYFAHPVLFFQKIVDEVNRLNLEEVNVFLQKVSLQPIEPYWQFPTSSDINISNLERHIVTLRESLSKLKDELSPYASRWIETKTEKTITAPKDKAYVYEHMQYKLNSVSASVIWRIRDLLKNLEFMSARVVLVIARAGQGKTNFVCDFAERSLLKRGIPCLFFAGREFNHTDPERIDVYFYKSVFGDRFSNLDEALINLNEFAAQLGKFIIIVIDGINEHKDIQSFSHHLERLTERVLEYPYIKLIFTCRLEYFEERFSNFKTSSFIDRTQFVDNLDRHMDEMHKDQMVTRYFRFFNITFPYISNRAGEVLENDTLLLRMFCEAYGDVNAEEPIRLPQIVDIYREKVFREYLQRKIEGASEFEQDTSRVRVAPGNAYRQALRQITQIMVDRKQFSDIPIADLTAQYHDAIGALLGEDVIVRKDLVSVSDVLDDKVEAINFTFDEFRDFLLANHLVNVVFRQDRSNFEEVVDEIVAPNSPVAEGIRTYLFFASKQPTGRDVHEVIESKEWYREIFIKSIFSVEEEFINKDDFDEIKTRFYENKRNASWIIRMLTLRWKSSFYLKLNISLLFEILNDLTEPSYDKLVLPSFSRFGVHGFDGNRSWDIGSLSSQLRRLLDDDSFVNGDAAEMTNLMELLIYLFPIWEEETYSTPAFDAFTKFTDLKPKVAVTLLRKHTAAKHTGIREQVWRMLSHAARLCEVPIELVDEACHLLRKAAKQDNEESTSLDGLDVLAREVVRFLEVVAEKEDHQYEDDIVTLMTEYSLFPYSYVTPDDNGT